MTEENIKLQYITPAIRAKWGLDRITMVPLPPLGGQNASSPSLKEFYRYVKG